MPKGFKNTDNNPSFVITAKMNPDVSEVESAAWDIWQSITRRDVLRAGFTSKAELLATALIQYHEGHSPEKRNVIEDKLDQILSRLKNVGVVYQDGELAVDNPDVLIDFAQNQQLLSAYIEGDQ